MRVNLHMKAGALAVKVETRKLRDEQGEGLVFQFFDPDAEEAKLRMATTPPDELRAAMAFLYQDALNIYERARREVMIPRSDGTWQKYAAIRYRDQIEQGWKDNELVPAIARIIRRRTLGFGHLANAGRPDLMLETLVRDAGKPYHRFFTATTIETARQRMRKHGFLDDEQGQRTP